jgi:hypothetical protein
MSHHGNSGIQEHSVGDLYPGGIRIESKPEAGEGVIVAYNLLTSEEYGRVTFADWKSDFDMAHRIAEALIPPDVPYRYQRKVEKETNAQTT